MPRIPRVTAREAERAILRDGWYLARSAGTNHRQYHHATKPGQVTIPHHAGQILDPKTIRSIIKQAGLTVDQFRNLL